jgi:hypothetical protein
MAEDTELQEQMTEMWKTLSANFEAWRQKFLQDMQPLLKTLRVCYIRTHYKGFFEKLKD